MWNGALNIVTFKSNQIQSKEDNTMKLEEKALLAKLKIGVWEARKKDKSVEMMIDETYKSHNIGSFRKIILNLPELKELESLGNQARSIHRTLTSPWNSDGTGILPIELHADYIKKLRSIKDKFEETFEKLESKYDDQIVKERDRLKTLFNPSDYPNLQELKGKFTFEIFFLPVPTVGDFRINLQSSEVDEIKSQFNDHLNSILADASRDLYQRLHDVIKHMYDRLSDPDGKFHNSMVKNIAELVQILPKLNFAGDEKLAELTRITEEELANLDTDDLRKFPEFREATADLAGEILKEVEELL